MTSRLFVKRAKVDLNESFLCFCYLDDAKSVKFASSTNVSPGHLHKLMAGGVT